MTVRNTTTAPDEMLEEWQKKAWLQRLFLPNDFLAKASAVGAESLVCHKTTNEYLVMSDKVEEKTLKIGQTGGYSTDLDYRPQGFKNETVRIINNASEVACSDCSGRGQAACPTTMNCGRCRGSGIDTSRCSVCNGRGEYVTGRRVSRRSGGIFRDRDDDYESEYYSTCSHCSGRGRVNERCSQCGASGQVVCNKCNGSGFVDCRQCDGAGRLVQGRVITRRFSSSTELTYQLSGLGENEFRNGLDGKHFKPLEGDLIYQEFQIPADPDTVLEQKSVHSYDVLSREYSYNDSSFCLNHITSGSASKYVASGIPLSKTKTAIAGAAFFVAAAAIAAVVILL